MMTLAERCLVDTNVLVYSTVAGNPWHQEARDWLAHLHTSGLALCVTPQILREYVVVLTRGAVFETQFSTAEVLAVVETLLQTLEVLDETTIVASTLRDLLRRYPLCGKRIHDANLVAVMLTYGITRLATYNRDDFVVFKEIVLEPLC
ncbi:MAG: type II toxin-antitoxin system VapC family toxin [Anaerolineae bacterium]|nr:type II toxin-antitoxin system VapC family toxin [Anaerolineae bacterium]